MNTLLTEYNEELHFRLQRELALEDGAMIKVVSILDKF